MAWQFDASTDQVLGDGWSGTAFSVLLAWFMDSDPNNFQNPLLVYSSAAGGGSLRAGIGTTADGTTMTTFDAAFLTQSAGAPGTGSWYYVALCANAASWITYHGSNPASLTTVGPDTRTTVTAPGSIVISLAAEWWRGRIANLKIYSRQLSAAEVAAELAAYEPISSTGLVRAHSMLTVPPGAPDYGAGASLTAGSTAVTLVAGPTALTRSVAVAGSTPRAVGALTGGSPVSGVLAGASPLAVGALTATETRTGVLAGSTSRPVGALTGGQVATAALAALAPAPVGALVAVLGATATLAGQAPVPVGALTMLTGLAVTLAGQAPRAVGALTATETRTAVLAGQAPHAVGALRPALNLDLPLRFGTPTKPGAIRAGTVTKPAAIRAGTPS